MVLGILVTKTGELHLRTFRRQPVGDSQRNLPDTLFNGTLVYLSQYICGFSESEHGDINSCCLVTKPCLTLFETMDYSLSSLHPWDFPGKNTAAAASFSCGIF